APTFGRKQWREHSERYLRALLVQTRERGNAENLAEAVDVPARSFQRFLTEASWDDAALTCQLQRYLAPRLNHPLAVWAVDESGVPKQGDKSVGVARQYCGALGKVDSCQIGVFLSHVGPRGRAIVDKRLYLPKDGWAKDPARCEAAGVPKQEREQGYRTKAQLALTLLERARQIGALHAEWVTADDEYGKSPEFRDGVERMGLLYAAEVPSNTWVWALPSRRVPARKMQVSQLAAEAKPGAWRSIGVAEGAQGMRAYRFTFVRVQENRDKAPGREVWLVLRRNEDGSEPRFYFSNAPERTPRRTLARVAASRWPIETELEVDKSHLGLDEYEVRSWQGWNHHITLCLLASAFLLTLQQDWGEKAALDHPAAGLPGGFRTAAAQALDARRPPALAA
ncbi:MAG TPA: IS701 family transposase, partial [Longimicrobiales bacterium]